MKRSRFVVGAIALLSACEESPAPSSQLDAAVSDRTQADLSIAPGTHDFVISALHFDYLEGAMSPNPDRHARGVPGFDLDARQSRAMFPAPGTRDCGHNDFFSELDPDQNFGTCVAGMEQGGAACVGGVDNRFDAMVEALALVGVDPRAALTSAVREGRFAVGIRVTGVDGPLGPTLRDDRVDVLVFPVVRPTFADCAAIGTPGLTYAIDVASLMRPEDLTSATVRLEGRIEAGRLVTATPSLDATATPEIVLPAPAVSATTPPLFRLSRAQLRVNLGPDHGDRGNLGGALSSTQVVSFLMSTPFAMLPDSSRAPLVASLIDLVEPYRSADGCTPPRGAMGIGFAFTLTRAVFAAVPVRGATVGGCGSPRDP